MLSVMGKVLNSILIHQLPKFWMARGQVVNRLKMVGDKFIRGEVDFFTSIGSSDWPIVEKDLKSLERLIV